MSPFGDSTMCGYYDDDHFDRYEPYEDDLMDWENRMAWEDGMADAASDAERYKDWEFPDDPSYFDEEVEED